MKKSVQRRRRDGQINELRKRCQHLSNKGAALEALNEREDAAPWIGRCFKYLNRDSDAKTWWMYIRVVAHEHGSSFRTVQCQSQTGGWHIATAKDRVYLLPDPKMRGYIAISRRQFDAAWRKFTARIKAVNA